MSFPKKYGGHERSMLERYVVTEELLVSGAPVAAHWIADRQSGSQILRCGTEEQKKDIIASNKKGDPTIYKISISLNYNIKKDNSVIFDNQILKQSTFNNIDDKFELLKYEENIVDSLSKKFAEDILFSVATLAK